MQESSANDALVGQWIGYGFLLYFACVVGPLHALLGLDFLPTGNAAHWVSAAAPCLSLRMFAGDTLHCRFSTLAASEENGVRKPWLQQHSLPGYLQPHQFLVVCTRYGMTWQEAVIVSWSGLRGAIAIFLALLVDLDTALPQAFRYQV